MFKTHLWQTHNEYRTLVTSVEKSTFLPDSSSVFSPYMVEKEKLLHLNFDILQDYFRPLYSHTGRPAKNQVQIFRSLILCTMLACKANSKSSLTAWVRDSLPNSYALTVLIGCKSANELPPLASYYDFMNRLWAASRVRYSRSFTCPSDKNSKRPKKIIDDSGKLDESQDSDKTTARTIVDNILSGITVTENPEQTLQVIFNKLAVEPSIRLGLIDTDNLTVSGDGTCVISHSNPYGRRIPTDKCNDNNADDIRHFSDPDAEWGWDSHEKCWYLGYSLYTLMTKCSNIKSDLPLLFNFTGARRHDSKNFLYAFDNFEHNLNLHPKNICLDSAHDNIPTYELLDSRNINALIDINRRTNKADDTPEDITLSKTGHPICRNGCEMIPWGNDPYKDAHKYRCPLKCGRIDSCPYSNECSSGSYGRTVYIKNKGDLRWHPNIPRDSKEFAIIYSERTAAERINNRILNDYGLKNLRIRGIHHFSFWTMLIGICIHMDAWYKAAYLYAKH